LAIAVSGLSVSLALGASAGELIAAFYGWPAVFLVLAGSSVLLAWLNRIVWCRQCGTAATGGSASPEPLAATVLARRLAPMVVWSTALYGVYTYIGVGLATFGFSTAQTALAVMCYGCGGIAGVLIGGRGADRLGA